ncbi:MULTISPECIES: hypothetical protein [Myxococcus]|uniref:Uncharacterized protein n=1 Tax=Myxococcus virescens TaxID=83456 RepID=A0A511HPI7_9BACT|nr:MULTISPECIES: hypothetical protein [Myxococcus]GEL75501.1 hypothetical protein MVI01_72850 [Myxococcus virescens]SDD48563.1 hypothetical protein SAMN04488504_1011068 [Myxococcus virescens]
MKKLLLTFAVLAAPAGVVVGGLGYTPTAEAQSSRLACTYTYYNDEALTEYVMTLHCSCANPDCHATEDVTPFFTVECIDAC